MYIKVSRSLQFPTRTGKLQGFCAAGGTIISLGKVMGLPYEILFGEWNFIGLFSYLINHEEHEGNEEHTKIFYVNQ